MSQQTIQADPLLGQILASNEYQPTTPDEMQQMLGQTYYLAKDELIQALLLEDEDLHPLYFALSHMVRTSNWDKKTKNLNKLRFRRSARIQLLLKKPANMVNYAKYDSICIYADAAMEDAHDGWRGRLMTERIRTYKMEQGQKKTSGLRSLFGR